MICCISFVSQRDLSAANEMLRQQAEQSLTELQSLEDNIAQVDVGDYRVGREGHRLRLAVEPMPFTCTVCHRVGESLSWKCKVPRCPDHMHVSCYGRR